MNSADKDKSPQAYCFPTTAPMESSVELSLSSEIQRRITGVANQLSRRLAALVAAVVPGESDRSKLLPKATLNLRRAVVSHAIECPTSLDGLAARVCAQIRPSCPTVPEERLRNSAVEHFGALDGDAQVVTVELAKINELATQFVKAHMGLVRKVARLFRPVSVAEEDLWQEGAIALRTAALQYDPTSGVKFGTFAFSAVKNHLTDIVRGSGYLTDYSARKLEEFAFAKETLIQKLGRTPIGEEIFDDLGWSCQTRKSVRSALGLVNPSSVPIGSEMSELKSPLSMNGSPPDTLIEIEELEQLQHRLKHLSRDEAAVITKRYVHGLSLRDIAKSDGKSDQLIRKLHDSALLKLNPAEPLPVGQRQPSKGA